MIAEILAVGTELLMGQTANTNAQYISSRLPDIGASVYYHTVVGDNPGRLKETLMQAIERSDVVILTGGLGPTMDDLTKETVASCLNKKMELHDESLSRIKAYFNKVNREMTQNNIKQAYIPEGAEVFNNNIGTAPGCMVQYNGKAVFMLPGPPHEMKPMFEEYVAPYLLKMSNDHLKSVYIRAFGIGEAELENKLMGLIEKQTNPTIATYVKVGEVTIRVTARYEKGNKEDILTPVVEAIQSMLGSNIFSLNDEDLEVVALNAARDRGLTLSFAESCTGGGISSYITAIPGASQALLGSAVTYSNSAKTSVLGVSDINLKSYGAVSGQVAEEMALGARKLFGSDIALSVTGVAGPDGGTDEKPIGLVYLAIATDKEVKVKKLNLSGSRERIIRVTCLHAFDTIRRQILDLPWLG